MENEQNNNAIANDDNAMSKEKQNTEFVDSFDGFEPIPDVDLKKVMGGANDYRLGDQIF